MRDLRKWVPAALLLLGCLGLLRNQTQRPVPLAGDIKGVLASIDGYRVTDQKVSDEERAVAGMTDSVARVYWRDTVAAFTTLVSYYDSQTQGKSIHSPRNCLPGGGWEVLTAGTATLEAAGRQHLVNRNVLKNGIHTALVWYWYQGRGRVESNEYRVKWQLLRDAALAGHTEEALVRVVVPVPLMRDPKEAEQAFATADSLGTLMAARLLGEVEQVLPKRVQATTVAIR
jgi:EpsI family protein